jgi:hypothetical protein
VVGLREAADDLRSVQLEIDAALARDPSAQLTQARVLLACGTAIEVIADTLTSDLVGIAGETMSSGSKQHVVALYKEVLRLIERARLAIARPGGPVEPVKSFGALLQYALPSHTSIELLVFLHDTLHRHFETDIEYARVTRSGAEQTRLNELLGQLKSRSNAAESLLANRMTGGSTRESEVLARTIFNEVLALWILTAQELVVPDITADLALAPESAATGKYAPDNVWMMTDRVARARYEADDRLDDLERDVKFEVLRGRPFQPNDIAFAQQADWLEQNAIFKRLASYWATSPHPPIYRALQDGQIRLDDRVVTFAKGDDVVWLCQMGQEMVGTDQCVLVGNMQSAPMRKLCGDMHNTMLGAATQRMGQSAMQHTMKRRS